MSGAAPTRVRLNGSERLVGVRLDVPSAAFRVQDQFQTLVGAVDLSCYGSRGEWSARIRGGNSSELDRRARVGG